MPRKASSSVPASQPPTFNLLPTTDEPGTTVSHYEFYTTIDFSSLHKGQDVIKKNSGGNGGHSETSGFVIIYNTGGAGYKGHYSSHNRRSFVPIAKGITKEVHTGFIAWVFDNVGPDRMGAFIMNHEHPSSSNNFSTTVNLGLDFTTSAARKLSAKIPSGGFKTKQEGRDMSGKLMRLRDVCKSQRDGVLQKVGCSVCREKVGRECRKIEGGKVGKCTWCRHFGRICAVPGEAAITGTESIDGSTVDGENEEESGDGGDCGRVGNGGMTLRKSTHRKPSRMLSLSDRKPLDIAGTKTLGGRVDKKKSTSNLKEARPAVERKKSAAELKHAMENFNIEDYRFPSEDLDD